MNVQWKNLLARITVWLVLEIALTFLGFDDVANYGEFIFEHNMTGLRQGSSAALVAMPINR